MAMSRLLGGTLLTTRPPIDDLATRDLLEPRDHAQQGRLAAAGGADEHDEFAFGNVDRDAVDDRGGAE